MCWITTRGTVDRLLIMELMIAARRQGPLLRHKIQDVAILESESKIKPSAPKHTWGKSTSKSSTS